MPASASVFAARKAGREYIACIGADVMMLSDPPMREDESGS